ncbi:MAG: ABC transporter substrate-binding protein, partial [Fibrobacterales bacterium]|nr:ABC transporter substrate-binding protein [Fibrobacterales bacterium]
CEVTVNMWNKGTMSVVVYKMKQENGQWRAWDFVIDDLSTMRNYRDQFAKILKEKDLDGLIETIRKKADEP